MTRDSNNNVYSIVNIGKFMLEIYVKNNLIGLPNMTKEVCL